MDTENLKQWAIAHDRDADWRSDRKLSLTSKLVRLRWKDVPSVAVGADVKDTKHRINAVLDGLAWYVKTHRPADDTLHVLMGMPTSAVGRTTFREHCDAVRTLAAAVNDGPKILLWTLDEHGRVVELEKDEVKFTTVTPPKWAAMLEESATMQVEGVAADLVARIHHPSFALYPKLSSLKSKEPWQLRLDGHEIGSAGKYSCTIKPNSSDLTKPGEPRETWRRIVGVLPVTLANTSFDRIVDLVGALIAAWSDPSSAAVLAHGQAEHALEAHVLSGRTVLETSAGRLRLAIPNNDGALRAAQFPTLWGDVIGPNRPLDALLADERGRPWAIELKDQDAGGGHGSYLRHGIGQAVLYCHYIRTAPGLDQYFSGYGLNRAECQAAVAYPKPVQAAVKNVASHKELAKVFGVEVIEFPRPGSAQFAV